MASIVSGYVGKIDPGNNTQYAIGSTAYGVCTTAAGRSAKVVDMNGFTLSVGATVFVKFQNANTATRPTLDVNSTGAYDIYLNGEELAGGDPETTGWKAGAVIAFTYDGAGWVRDQGYNTNTKYTNLSFGQGYGTSSTGNNAAKVAVCSGYELAEGGIVAIKFDSECPENSTLNINATGAKPIYYNGERLPEKIILDGDTGTFIYDGSYYHLLSIDRWGATINALVGYAVTGFSAGSVTNIYYDNENPNDYRLIIDNGSAPQLTQSMHIGDVSYNNLTPNIIAEFEYVVVS